ncbi:MAG: hypothetical protein AAF902_03125, partial [Chloroflexota bacterium]
EYVQQLNLYRSYLNSSQTSKDITGNMGLSYDWSRTGFKLGTRSDWKGKYDKLVLGTNLRLVADYVSDGLIVYWFEWEKGLDPVLIPALEKELSTNQRNALRHSGFVPNLSHIPATATEESSDGLLNDLPDLLPDLPNPFENGNSNVVQTCLILGAAGIGGGAILYGSYIHLLE